MFLIGGDTPPLNKPAYPASPAVPVVSNINFGGLRAHETSNCGTFKK